MYISIFIFSIYIYLCYFSFIHILYSCPLRATDPQLTNIASFININIIRWLYCHAKAKDCNFNFGWKWVIDIFGTFKTSFIMCISILSQFRCFYEKIMGGLNRNFEKPWRNQGRTPYNTSNGSFTLFGTLKLSLCLTVRQNEFTVTAWSYTVFCLFFFLSIKVCRI